MNGLGETKTLQALIDEVFAPFPQRDDDHGGREQAVRRALWRGFLLDGILSPSVQLLLAFNVSLAKGKYALTKARPRVIGLTEWWVGDSPFLLDGILSPSVQLLLAFNVSLAKGKYALTKARPRVIGLTEWWVGDSPSWDIRFHETFYAPSSGARFILAFALMGHPHEEAKPQQDPNDLPSLPILYEDEHLVVINKPARLSSVPGGSETVSAKLILEATYGELFVIHRLDMGTSGVLAFAKTKDALRPLNKAFSDRNAHKTILEATYGELFVIHRLDMGTSGVLAFAKTKDALRPLNKAFSDRNAHKTYVARLEGTIMSTNGTISLPIALNWFDRPKQAILPTTEGGRDAVTTYRVLETVNTASGPKTLVELSPITGNWFDRPKQAILPTTEGGRDAVTTYRVLETVNTASGPKTLVELSPITGRTHQLRMHCAHPEGLNCPIDGDPFYGHGGLKEEARTRRLCLHAASLSIVHPMTGEPLTVVAPNCPIDGDPFYGHGGLKEEARTRRLCLHAASLSIVHPMTGEPLTVVAPAAFPDF